jgi:hypothetical protein
MSASLTPVSNTTFNPGKRNILPFLPPETWSEKFKVQGSRFKVRGMPIMNSS